MFSGKRAKLLATVAAMFLSTVAVTASAQVTEVTYRLVFSNENDVFTFELEKAGAAGDLIVDTRDAGIAGDFWQVDIFAEQPANPMNDVTAVGNGSLDVFSGDAISHPFVRGEVDVSYNRGIDIFPAGMEVRFRYTGNDGIYIDRVPSAAAFSTLSADSVPCSGDNC